MQFYAVSTDVRPDSHELERKIAKDGRGMLGFPLLSDYRSTVIDRYGLRDPDYARDERDGIPRPAVFVLDPQGRVRWVKIESDYRERPSNEEVAAAIDSFE